MEIPKAIEIEVPAAGIDDEEVIIIREEEPTISNKTQDKNVQKKTVKCNECDLEVVNKGQF